MLKPYIEAGKIVGVRGVKGEMRVLPYCDAPSFLTGFKVFYLDPEGSAPLPVSKIRVHKNVVLLTSPGVRTADSAESMRGKSVYISRRDAKLPAGSCFIGDLIGCKVYRENGEYLGSVSAVSPTGANDVWHVEKNGREYLVPAVEGIVESVDTEREKVVINPPRGIFDDEN